ncbi:MAG: bifunctional 3-deoxy-7-phosphoheptulonate synthase/chorismate mutase type II [Paludibacteraceae bacterium]|nr:bifunctional 3-deoxy-7-phosphoheptulonate synthase/chorismate mutase type II [Paludibacteraceae bacterium]
MILLSGPCAAESRDQVLLTAQRLSEALSSIPSLGAMDNLDFVFRAGVWKPRSQPGYFEGAGIPALSWLQEVQETMGIPVATEVASAEHVELVLKHGIHHLWLGARTTTNPFLVSEIAGALTSYADQLTVYVKNPMSPDLNLWKGAIQRVSDVIGIRHVVAVHRGFSTGQATNLRNNPCWAIVSLLKRHYPDLPILMDASHMSGQRALIPSLCQQAVNLKYGGWMLESHFAPDLALSDANQQLLPEDVKDMLTHLNFRILPDELGLAPFRAEIDELDETIWQLIAQRMQVSSRIGEYKQAHGLPVLQEQRYDDLLQHRLEWARQNEISESLVHSIMDAIHSESCRRQQ